MILSICQPMVDRRIKTTAEHIKEFNLATNGYTEISSTSNLASSFNEAHVYREAPGGSSLNTLRLLNIESSIELAFIGAIGDDKTSASLFSLLENDRIKYKFEQISGKTAECTVLISNNERSLLTTLGVANKMSLSFLKEQKDMILGSKIVYMCAFFAAAMDENIRYVLDIMSDQVFVFNLSYSALFGTFDKGLLNKIHIRSNVIIGNKGEICSFYRAYFHCENVDLNMMKVLEDISKNGNYDENRGIEKIVICTDGENDTLCYGQNGFASLRVEDIKGNNLDTCGAGDYFAAGVLYEMYDRKEIDVLKCIKTGHLWAKRFIIENSKLIT